MSGPQQRAERRRFAWQGEVVVAGHPKESLYRSLTPAQRLLALARLNQRVFATVGMAPTAVGGSEARRDWPGEVFEISRRG